MRHYDLYRIQSPREIDELGLDEALEDGAALIEWPENAGDRLPEDVLLVHLTADGEQSRRVEIAGPARWASLFSDTALVR